MQDLADGLRMIDQRDEGSGEILGVCTRPHGLTIPMDDDRLSGFNAFHHRPRRCTFDGDGDVLATVGLGWSDDGDRETMLMMRLQEDLLSGGFVLTIDAETISAWAEFIQTG